MFHKEQPLLRAYLSLTILALKWFGNYGIKKLHNLSRLLVDVLECNNWFYQQVV